MALDLFLRSFPLDLPTREEGLAAGCTFVLTPPLVCGNALLIQGGRKSVTWFRIKHVTDQRLDLLTKVGRTLIVAIHDGQLGFSYGLSLKGSIATKHDKEETAFLNNQNQSNR